MSALLDNDKAALVNLEFSMGMQEKLLIDIMKSPCPVKEVAQIQATWFPGAVPFDIPPPIYQKLRGSGSDEVCIRLMYRTNRLVPVLLSLGVPVPECRMIEHQIGTQLSKMSRRLPVFLSLASMGE